MSKRSKVVTVQKREETVQTNLKSEETQNQSEESNETLEQLEKTSNVTGQNEESSQETQNQVEEVTSSTPAVIETPQAAPVEVKSAPVIQSEKGFKPVYKIEANLIGYSEAMAIGKPITPEEGGKWQYSLYKTILGILNNQNAEEFKAEMQTLLQYFFQNKDNIFNEKFIYRFPAQWPGSQTEFNLYRRVVFVLIQTANPKTRSKEAGKLNLEKVSEGMTEDQKNKFINFFS